MVGELGKRRSSGHRHSRPLSSYIGGWLLALIIAVIATMGARELYRMAEAGGVPPLDGVGAPLAGCSCLRGVRDRSRAAVVGTLIRAAARGSACDLAARSGRSSAGSERGHDLWCGVRRRWTQLRGCTTRLGNDPTWAGAGSVVATATGGAILVAMPIALTWLGDTFAYFRWAGLGSEEADPERQPRQDGGRRHQLGGRHHDHGCRVCMADPRCGSALITHCCSAHSRELLVSITAQIGDLADRCSSARRAWIPARCCPGTAACWTGSMRCSSHCP